MEVRAGQGSLETGLTEISELTPQGHILGGGQEVVHPGIPPPTPEREKPHKRRHLEGPLGFQELSRWGSGHSPQAGTPKGEHCDQIREETV